MKFHGFILLVHARAQTGGSWQGCASSSSSASRTPEPAAPLGSSEPPQAVDNLTFDADVLPLHSTQPSPLNLTGILFINTRNSSPS